MSETRIIERVKKLLAMSKDEGATEQERETALRMAHAMLLKHNMSMSSIKLDENTEVRQRDSFQKRSGIWARALGNAVAKLFYCKYYYTRYNGGREEHFFVGRQSNVITSMHMSEYLIDSIIKEAKKRYGDHNSLNGRSFCTGAVRVISSRVTEIIEREAEDNAVASNCTALAIVNHRNSEVSANDAFLAAEGTKLKTSTDRTKGFNGGAYQNGKQFGGTVSLNQQVTGAKSNFALLK